MLKRVGRIDWINVVAAVETALFAYMAIRMFCWFVGIDL